MRELSILNIREFQNEINGLPGVEPSCLLSSNPKDAFSSMVTDAELKKRTEKLFREGNYAEAVHKAFMYLDNLVKKVSKIKDKKITGAPLMNKVFNTTFPILKLNKGISQSEQDEQCGYMQIMAGSMVGIRNPRSHDSDWKDTESRALELLTLANHLVCRVRLAEKNESV